MNQASPDDLCPQYALATKGENGSLAGPVRLNAEYSANVTAGLVAAADSIAILLAGGLLYLLLVAPSEASLHYLSVSALAATLIVMVFTLTRLYDFDALVRPEQQMKKIILV